MNSRIDRKKFDERYQKLNENQREAVNITYGPAMVIAGPGTGKTEVLSMRIANLLLSEIQVNANEILCLTFTDEATVAMRRRLLEIIGEDAHRIHIFTFHAFCNQIIQYFPEYFGMRDLSPITDLERMDLVYHLIDELPEGHLLRRLKGNIYYDAKYLISLFNLMKSEDWSHELISEQIDSYLNDLPNREEFQYKRANSKKGIKVGDLKEEDIRKETERMERTRAAAQLFPEYQRRMEAAGRYDFSDMILWVIKAFKEHSDLLRIQQERFQFILVDEFQDTSGAQYEILTLLADYWEDPNIFIVGDDDQSVFEFQGARIENIVDFFNRYSTSIQPVVLKENYRSTQAILDKATQSIENNQTRLVKVLKQILPEEYKLEKDLIASHPRFKTEDAVQPVVRVCYNAMHEEAYVVEEIEALRKKGVDLSDVAVLYAQHRQASNIIAQLEKKGIPYWVKRPVNILDIPFIQQLLQLLRYIEQELTRPFSGEAQLFRLMHAPFLGISALDIASLSIYLQSKERKHVYWRYLLQDVLYLESMGLLSTPAIRKLGANIEQWIKNADSLTMPMLLEKIVYDGGLLSYIMQREDQIWEMQVLHSFFEFVREECIKRPRMKIGELLEIAEQMDREQIPLGIQKVVKQDNGVRFYTAFAAKGHEFEHVFLIGLNKNFWEGKSGGQRGFSLPDTLTGSSSTETGQSNSEEVARRLFYVAVTRAKKYLYMSYAQMDNKDKVLEPSQFVDEVSAEHEREQLALTDKNLLPHLVTSLEPAPKVQVTLAKRELIDRRLESFALSVSAMNKYLNCPLSFYYEYILRVPAAKSDAMAFGTAIHYALEQLFKKMQAHHLKMFPRKDELVSWFQYAMRREESAFTEQQYERRRELGVQLLSDYYNEYLGMFNKTTLTELNISNVVVEGVPIKGKLDKLEFTGNECVVVDYKTGDPDFSGRKQLYGPSPESPNGGDYWRQMVFYKILLEVFPPARTWKMTAGMFDFIEKNKKGEFVRFLVPIDEDSVRTVKQQIKEVYEKIMAREFHTGCGDKDCYWCSFANQFELNQRAGETQNHEADAVVDF